MGYFVTSEICAGMYVVLFRAEKHVIYGVLVGTSMYDVIVEVLHSPRPLQPSSTVFVRDRQLTL